MGRKTVRETELANGLILPAGAEIALHVFELHRNSKYWSDPDEFQPERFLPENSKDRHTYAYMPFSAGQRNCIGKFNLGIGFKGKTALCNIPLQVKSMPCWKWRPCSS